MTVRSCERAVPYRAADEDNQSPGHAFARVGIDGVSEDPTAAGGILPVTVRVHAGARQEREGRSDHQSVRTRSAAAFMR